MKSVLQTKKKWNKQRTSKTQLSFRAKSHSLAEKLKLAAEPRQMEFKPNDTACKFHKLCELRAFVV